MNQPTPSDPELDRLLARRITRTSPEFEQRWRDLRATLTAPAGSDRARPRRWFLWPGLATATLVALLAVMLLRSPRGGLSPAKLGAFDDVLALEAALAPAVPLLEAENREALLNLPATSTRYSRP